MGHTHTYIEDIYYSRKGIEMLIKMAVNNIFEFYSFEFFKDEKMVK